MSNQWKPSSSGSSVLSTTTDWTAAQIFASHPAGLPLVAAPGANKVIVPGLIVAYYTFVTTVYTNPGSAVFVGADSTGSTAWKTTWTAMNSVLIGSASKVLGFDAGFEIVDSDGAVDLSAVADQPLALDLWPDAPSGDGTLKIFATYSVFALT